MKSVLKGAKQKRICHKSVLFENDVVCLGRSHSSLLREKLLLIFPSVSLVCMDVDEAGEKAAVEIVTLSRAVKNIQVPIGKDMNEFYRLANGPVASDWLMSQLPLAEEIYR